MSLFRKKDLAAMLAHTEDQGKGLKRTLGAGNLVALGIGAILVYNDLEKQNTLIITFALGMLLTGLALLYSLFFDSIAKTWFAAIPAIVSLISSALLWYARSQAKHILKKGKSD